MPWVGAPSPSTALDAPDAHPTYFPADLLYPRLHTHALTILHWRISRHQQLSAGQALQNFMPLAVAVSQLHIAPLGAAFDNGEHPGLLAAGFAHGGAWRGEHAAAAASFDAHRHLHVMPERGRWLADGQAHLTGAAPWIDMPVDPGHFGLQAQAARFQLGHRLLPHLYLRQQRLVDGEFDLRLAFRFDGHEFASRGDHFAGAHGHGSEQAAGGCAHRRFVQACLRYQYGRASACEGGAYGGFLAAIDGRACLGLIGAQGGFGDIQVALRDIDCALADKALVLQILRPLQLAARLQDLGLALLPPGLCGAGTWFTQLPQAGFGTREFSLRLVE